jgi:chemosensory pili system protein ChpA (sensor histidine kinase/response regulator)
LADYSQDTDKNMYLETCWNYVHQLNGLLEMVELHSVIVVSRQMEKLIEALIQGQMEPDPEIFNTLQQASDALMHYLDELIDGGNNSPLHLFPVYRSLMQAQGIDDIAESHLFFKNLDVNPPLQDALLNLSSTEIQQTAKQARSEYQPALLKWLRDTDDKESLQSMAYAISLFEKFQGSVRQRAFWWICSGFFDGILHQPNEVDLSIRQLCGKIEQEMRRIERGLPTNNDSLMREILYQIARCQMDSPLIDEIKLTYEWPEGITSVTLSIKDETAQSALKKMQAHYLKPKITGKHSTTAEIKKI